MALSTIVVVIALVLIHFLLRVGFGIGLAAPDLLTVALLLAARETRLGWAAGVGFLFGLLEDALSVLAFGANALTMTLVGIAGATTRALFVGDSWLFIVSYFFIGKWLRDLLHWIFMGEQLRRPFVEQVLLQGLPAAAYAALAGLAILWVVGMSNES